jgi:hypothetical protein
MPHAYGRVLKIALQFVDKQIQNSAPHSLQVQAIQSLFS